MMRKTIKMSFKQLVLENKKELMNNEKEMEKIEKKIEDKMFKSIQENAGIIDQIKQIGK